MAPQDFLNIKQKIQTSTILSDSEKKEWLFLLPKMKPEQLRELDRILSIKLPEVSSPLIYQPINRQTAIPKPPFGLKPQVSTTPVIAIRPPRRAEKQSQSQGIAVLPPAVRNDSLSTAIAQPVIKKPVTLPAPPPPPVPKSHDLGPINRQTTITTPSLKTTPPSKPLVKPQEAPAAVAALPPVGGRYTVEQIKSLSVSDMRRAPSIYPFLETLASSMRSLLQSRQATAESLRWAFEQSPLHRTYLEAGIAKMSGQAPDSLTHDEFEALTDFRSAMRKILT